MNVKNNRRRKESVSRIENAFMQFIQTKEIRDITVSDICKAADVNRSTFYANFIDIYDLAEKIKEHLESELHEQFGNKNNVMKAESDNTVAFFHHIKDNQLFYRTYFRLDQDRDFKLIGYDIAAVEDFFTDEMINYHIEFFRNGLNAIIKKWLEGGCIESPETMAQILKSEYQGRSRP